LEASAAIQPFLEQYEAIAFLSEYSDKISYPQVFVIRTLKSEYITFSRNYKVFAVFCKKICG
jgi:hypothetical protein